MENIMANDGADVLDLMANLSNDEVFTPTRVVNEVLDLLPNDVWTNPQLVWLNPTSKNGVWLREIKRRLMIGLESSIPYECDREEHILMYMVLSFTTSELAYLLTCRTMYAVKDSEYFKYKNSEFNELNNIQDKRFLDLIDEEYEMPKVDVVVGNPPYQINDGGGTGSSATPLYHKFIESCIDTLNPTYITMIIPSRWMVGGRGLNVFRKRMMNDTCIKIIEDSPNSKKYFPSVDIKGGVCYFLRDTNHNGECMFNGVPRQLNKYGVIIRDNKFIPIIDKVLNKHNSVFMSDIVSSSKPFSLRSNFKDWSKDTTNSIKCYSIKKSINYVSVDKITDNANIKDKWKVVVAKAGDGASSIGDTYRVTGTPFIIEPNAICTETYLVLDSFDSENDAKKMLRYAKSKFFRFMLSLYVSTQNISKDKFRYVPKIDGIFDDNDLYDYFSLTAEEIELIENTIKPIK